MKWPFGRKEAAPPQDAGSAEGARAQLLWRQGSRYLARRKYEQAIESFVEAFQLEPSRLDGRLNMGAAYFLAGQPSEAIPHLKYVLALEPQNTAALLNLAAAYDGNGQLPESVEILERLVHDRPQWRDAHYNLAVGYYKMERFDDAMTALRAELLQHPDHEAARTLLNELHLKPRAANSAKKQPVAAPDGASPPSDGLKPVAEPPSS